jgi:hypothetical protein
MRAVKRRADSPDIVEDAGFFLGYPTTQERQDVEMTTARGTPQGPASRLFLLTDRFSDLNQMLYLAGLGSGVIVART